MWCWKWAHFELLWLKVKCLSLDSNNGQKENQYWISLKDTKDCQVPALQKKSKSTFSSAKIQRWQSKHFGTQYFDNSW